ncbi:hypothetical protein H5410_057750, partial [Solanum commersonii]
MEIEKRSKFQNDLITLHLIDEPKWANSSKRKESSKPTVNERKIDKRRKVNNVISRNQILCVRSPIKPLHMQIYANHNIVTDLKGKLTPTMFNQFKDTCFEVYIKMHECRCKHKSLDELLIRINQTTLCFDIKEFAIITGLNCFSDENGFLFDTSEPNKIIEQYFEGKSTIKKAELISKYKKKVWGEGNDDDLLRAAGTMNIYGKKDAFLKLVKSITKEMDAVKQYYRIAGMSLLCKFGYMNTNRIPKLINWRTRNSRPHYEFLMKGMFSDNDNSLKYQNIHPSLKEVAFYQFSTENDAIPENASEKDGDKDKVDDFTSKPPTHKSNNKNKGKVKIIVPLSTLIKKMSMTRLYGRWVGIKRRKVRHIILFRDCAMSIF